MFCGEEVLVAIRDVVFHQTLHIVFGGKLQNKVMNVLKNPRFRRGFFYSKFFLSSSLEMGLKYAGATSKTVLHPDCPS